MMFPAEAAKATIARHCEEAGLDDEGSVAIGVYHLLRDLIDLCDAEKLDLDLVLENARRDARDDA